MGQIDIIQIVG